MDRRATKKSSRIYRAMLSVYPKQYRQEFGDEMAYVFERTIDDAYAANGMIGVVGVWMKTIFDTVKTALHQQTISKGDTMKQSKKSIVDSNKIFGWITSVIAVVLLVPLTAMQFSREVDWSALDFIVVGSLLFVMAALYVVIARKTRLNRMVLASVVGLITMLLYVELAVGIFNSPFAGS